MNLRKFKIFPYFVFSLISILTSLIGLRAFAAKNVANPNVSILVNIDSTDTSITKINGNMKVSSISNAVGGGDVCFYLPYQDPEYGMNRGDMQRFQLLTANHRKPHFFGGRMSIQKLNVGQLELETKQYIVRIRMPKVWDESNELDLKFEADVPRLERSRAQERVFDGFFPQLLKKCPSEDEVNNIALELNAAFYDVNISMDPDWDYLGPGISRDGAAKFSGLMTYPAFILVKGFKKKILRIGQNEVVLAYQSDHFLDLAPTIVSAFGTFEEIFGPYPFPKLTIVENSELLRQTIPGLISINRPPQLIFDKVQKNLLNWQHWIAVMQLSRQWLGSTVFPATPDDEWLLSGTSEYATLEALKEIPLRFDLFNESFWGEKWFALTYLQVNEILTSMLKKNCPYCILTGDNLETYEPLVNQDKLLFLRHTAALRQIESVVGPNRFRGFLKKMVRDYRFRSLAPKELMAQLDLLPSPFSPAQRALVAEGFKKWWTLSGWPDFELLDFQQRSISEGKWMVEGRIDQKGGIDHEPIVKVVDLQGRVTHLKSLPRDHLGGWKVEAILDAPIEEVAIDPAHKSFDSNRFNNSSHATRFYLFPGTAKTLADDAYTLVWVPYPFRRPGEAVSLGVQGGLFKYVQSALTTMMEFAPSTRENSYQINYVNHWANSSIANGGKFQKTYDGDREVELNVFENNLFKSTMGLGIGLVVKRKERLGDRTSVHGAYGMRLGFRPPGDEKQCQFNLVGSLDKAPRSWSTGFSYTRNLGLLAGECRVSHQMSLSLRGFVGRMSGDGEIPDSAFFKPNDLSEARLRIDQGLDAVANIDTLTSDLYFPLNLPIPFDFLILSRQLKWRVFYDLGRSKDEALNYSSTGLGFQMPIGGDLSGAGSLAFTKLSLLLIMESRIGDRVIKKPTVLFDFTGQL